MAEWGISTSASPLVKDMVEENKREPVVGTTSDDEEEF